MMMQNFYIPMPQAMQISLVITLVSVEKEGRYLLMAEKAVPAGSLFPSIRNFSGDLIFMKG